MNNEAPLWLSLKDIVLSYIHTIVWHTHSKDGKGKVCLYWRTNWRDQLYAENSIIGRHFNLYTRQWKRDFLFIICLWCTFATITYGNVWEQGNISTQISHRQRASQLMDSVFAYGESHPLKDLQYVGNAYVRHRMYTKRRGPIVRYIPGMLRLESGVHNYLTEAQLRIQYRPSGDLDCKVVAYCSTSRYQNAQRFNGMGKLNFLIYDTKLLTDRILNPLHRRNRRFYRYTYLFTTYQVEQHCTVAHINIQPRFSNDQLVEGYVDIDVATGAVRNFVFKMHYHLQTITVAGSLGEGEYESLIPGQMRILSHFKLMGNLVNEIVEISAHHTFSCPTTQGTDTLSIYDLTRQCMVRIDTSRCITSPAYFDSIRPYPLRDAEADLIRSLPDSLVKMNLNESASSFLKYKEANKNNACSNAPADSTSSMRHNFSERTQDVLLSSHAFNLSSTNRAWVKLPPILTPSMIQWSHSKGFSLRTRIRCEFFTLKGDDRPCISFSPSIGYSFKQKQLYYNVPLLVRFLPQYDGSLHIVAGGGSHMYNSRQASELRESLRGVEKYDSLLNIIDHYGFHDYRDAYVRLDCSFSLRPGLTLRVGGRFHRRALITWNEVAERGGLSRHLSTIGPRWEIEWTPRQYYYRQGMRRIPLYSNYPTFLFSYERGFGLSKVETRYERLEADMRYRFSLYAMRTLYFRVGGGIYTRRGRDCFLDYDYFRFSYIPDGWDDDMTGELQLLSSRWYNESRYYARFNGTYESPMLWFSRIPGLSRLVQKERVYLNMLSVRALGFYSEAGYGFSTHLLDVGAFLGIASDRSMKFGCKLVLKFFDY